MRLKSSKPHHMNATEKDIAGNGDIGRYFILPGSEGRAKEIASHFENVSVKTHDRGHNLYLGTLTCEDQKIDVAAISSGMGCPSMEIILHELFHLGAKRFLRVGTAGSMQPDLVKIGDLINTQAAVRDEDTTTHYAAIEIPAIASLEVNTAILFAAEQLGLSDHLHTGIVHCKSSLYAREFGSGPRGKENDAYMAHLADYGVLASEMETSALFVQSQIYNHQLMKKTPVPQRVLSGAILGIVATVESAFDYTPKAAEAVKNSIALAIETIKILALQELIH